MTDEETLNKFDQTTVCQHSYYYKGEIDKYYSYECSKCNKIYWVNTKESNTNKQ